MWFFNQGYDHFLVGEAVQIAEHHGLAEVVGELIDRLEYCVIDKGAKKIALRCQSERACDSGRRWQLEEPRGSTVE